ncbi:MAG: DUF4416 family protein [Peptococcaceae bacterium]|nr:DUF4416 family protein [Peptococcaceae bacterium]
MIVGLLYCDEGLAKVIEKKLESLFGRIDCRSSVYRFSNISTYYDAEMGGKVNKYFFSFETCVDPSRLVEIKLMTNDIEKEYSRHGFRNINLDPGLMGHGRLTLATTKNAPHRVPLHSGIYAEITLFFARKDWQSLPWTYMDFKTDETKSFLREVRTIYLKQRQSK